VRRILHEGRGTQGRRATVRWGILSLDYRYYDRKFIEASLALDDALVKEYFPVSVVVPTILEIYQNLLGVRFEQLDGETWHPEVQMYAVWEDGANDESGNSWGTATSTFSRAGVSLHKILLCLSLNLSWSCSVFLFDDVVLARGQRSKYSRHAGSMGPYSWFSQHWKGKRSYPLTAMVANLAKQHPDRPALMRTTTS